MRLILENFLQCAGYDIRSTGKDRIRKLADVQHILTDRGHNLHLDVDKTYSIKLELVTGHEKTQFCISFPQKCKKNTIVA